MENRDSYNDKVARLAWIESMIEYAYSKSLEFDNISDLRIHLADKLVKIKNVKFLHLDVIIENPFIGFDFARQQDEKYLKNP